MGLISTEIKVKLHSQMIKYYEEKGYEIPRKKYKNGKLIVPRETKILVKIEDLANNSHAKVDVQCDGCGKELKQLDWSNYKKCVKEDGTYYCQKCAINGFEKYTSFYEWCYKNLSKEEADKIMLRWDYDLNIGKNKKIISPKDATYSSAGLNKKGYWFKCLDHSEHISELKSISNFTNGEKGSILCNQCNTISITHSELEIFLVDKNDMYKYSFGSNEKILMKCPDCGYEKKKAINTLISQGFGCPKCSDGISYPEKFIFNVLEQLNINFQTQLTKTTFKWCNKYKYDFYLIDTNGIVETHGIQHYEETRGKWGTLKEIQENDKDKEQLAKENDIKDDHYITLDCRKSELEWIKNSIMNSNLPNLLNFKESNINWLKAHEAGCLNLVKICSYLWENGINIIKIADKLKIHKETIRKYLKQGSKLKWCDYNPQEEKNKFNILMKEKRSKKIICLTTNEIFNSILDAKNKYNTSHISHCCMNKRKSAGKLPDGTKLKWMYYDEYIQKNGSNRTNHN